MLPRCYSRGLMIVAATMASGNCVILKEATGEKTLNSALYGRPSLPAYPLRRKVIVRLKSSPFLGYLLSTAVIFRRAASCTLKRISKNVSFVICLVQLQCERQEKNRDHQVGSPANHGVKQLSYVFHSFCGLVRHF